MIPMTDKDNIKALECCILGDCQGCYYGNTDQRHCRDDLMQNSLNLINRQKAEIEHWQKKWTENYRKGGIDAIKFFADRLKCECLNDEKLVNMAWINVMNHIDNLVKEMVGDNE